MVNSVWFGGSYTSTKIDPNDLDCTFFIGAESFLMASVDDRKIIESFQRRVPAPLPGRTVPRHGIPGVDSFAVLWMPDPAPQPDAPSLGGQYVRARGYWDDWWSRYRTSGKTDPVMREDMLPRRGYLEVILDGFA